MSERLEKRKARTEKLIDCFRGNTRDEARHALTQVKDDEAGVRWYETGGKR